MIVHIDADLYSATLFVLTSIYPFLKKNDIIIFDEFNVANHEFKAFMAFVDAFYFKYEVIGAANNFYQLAIKVS